MHLEHLSRAHHHATVEQSEDAYLAVTDAVHAGVQLAAAFNGLATFSLTDVLARLSEHSGVTHHAVTRYLTQAEKAGAIRPAGGTADVGRDVWTLVDEDALYEALPNIPDTGQWKWGQSELVNGRWTRVSA